MFVGNVLAPAAAPATILGSELLGSIGVGLGIVAKPAPPPAWPYMLVGVLYLDLLDMPQKNFYPMSRKQQRLIVNKRKNCR